MFNHGSGLKYILYAVPGLPALTDCGLIDEVITFDPRLTVSFRPDQQRVTTMSRPFAAASITWPELSHLFSIIYPTTCKSFEHFYTKLTFFWWVVLERGLIYTCASAFEHCIEPLKLVQVMGLLQWGNHHNDKLVNASTRHKWCWGKEM